MSELKIVCPNCESEYSFPKFPQKCPKCGTPFTFTMPKINTKKSK